VRVKIIATNERGEIFEGEMELAQGRRGPVTRRSGSKSRASAEQKIDLSLPRRAFLKRYAEGGGPRKFTVLLAHMTQGESGVEVKREDIEREWHRNKGVLGGPLQNIYSTRSKEKGWTDSPKRGSFVLRPEWRGALGAQDE